MITGNMWHRDVNEFMEAFCKAEDGEQIVYAVGEMSRTLDMFDGVKPLLMVKNAALDLWYHGRVHLVQRRIEGEEFKKQYIAVKCNGRGRERPTSEYRYTSRKRRRAEDGADRREREEGAGQPAAGVEVAV